jgi:Flp pilus assembly protein TadD
MMSLPLQRACLALSVGMVLLGTAPRVMADVYDEVARQVQAGQPQRARQQAEQHLRQHPQDPQMRLILAQAQDALGRTDEALDTLQTLSASFPELPEVHNNLAVLYARQGRLDLALASLQSAVRIRPDYGVALENLGDLHSQMAQQAYGRARQNAPALRRLSIKLDLVRQILQPTP